MSAPGLTSSPAGPRLLEMQSSPVCSHENSHCHKQDHTSLLLKTLMTLANSRENVTALVTSCEAPCALAPTSPTLYPTTPLLPGAPLCRSQGTARAWSSAWMPSLLIVLVKSPSSVKAHLAVAFPRLFSRPEALALSLSSLWQLGISPFAPVVP